MKTTKRDRGNIRTIAAICHLVAAQHDRNEYDRILQAAILAYGDITFGSVISGIYADHFPEDVKDKLRFLARDIGRQTDYAVAAWQAAGRRIDTIRPLLQEYRILADGRVSYY